MTINLEGKVSEESKTGDYALSVMRIFATDAPRMGADSITSRMRHFYQYKGSISEVSDFLNNSEEVEKNKAGYKLFSPGDSIQPFVSNLFVYHENDSPRR